LSATNVSDIDAAFATAEKLRAGAMLVCSDPFLNSQRDKIVALAARHAIPAMYEQREHALAGGLISYGTNLGDGYAHAGVYAGRILRGEKPGDLPVVQSTKFELVINLKTAKALGIEVPPNLSAEADETSNRPANVRFWHKADISRQLSQARTQPLPAPSRSAEARQRN
jgi:putative ABC transport system substrate-binding protein